MRCPNCGAILGSSNVCACQNQAAAPLSGWPVAIFVGSAAVGVTFATAWLFLHATRLF